MIFLDSWVWIEYFSQGKKAEEAEDVILKIEEAGGVISTFVLFEVKYVLSRKFSQRNTNKIISLIKSIPNLAVLPVTTEVAERAASLRRKYYSKKNPFSSGDAVVLATAEISRCDTIFTGDSDFGEVTEISPEII